jgi:hypothetical protein
LKGSHVAQATFEFTAVIAFLRLGMVRKVEDDRPSYTGVEHDPLLSDDEIRAIRERVIALNEKKRKPFTRFQFWMLVGLWIIVGHLIASDLWDFYLYVRAASALEQLQRAMAIPH